MTLDRKGLNQCEECGLQQILEKLHNGAWFQSAAFFKSRVPKTAMEMQQVRYFLAIVREESFSRAATACSVAQPSITRAIRRLEDEMGGLLFDRRRNRVELTELGRSVLPRFERVEAELAEATRSAASVATARRHVLRLGLMCTLGPQRLIDLLDSASTRINGFELRLQEGKARTVMDQLVADRFDVAIACLPKFPEEISAQPLYSERYVVAFRSGHRFERMDEVAFDELIGEDYLERLNCEFDEYYADHFGEQPFDLNVRYASEREDWIQAMILAGHGIAILPEHLPLMPGILVRPLSQPTMTREVSILTVRGRRHAPATDAFIRAASALKRRSG